MDIPNDPESLFVTELLRSRLTQERSKPAMSTSAAVSNRCLRLQLSDLRYQAAKSERPGSFSRDANQKIKNA